MLSSDPSSSGINSIEPSLTNQPRLTLDQLPSEIKLLIASQLTYPDALSLKHSQREFYHLVNTGVQLKVEWLLTRRQLHLTCPCTAPCSLRTDRDFCRGSVSALMERRRRHLECEAWPGGKGCLVLETKVCTRRMRLLQRVYWVLSRRTWWLKEALLAFMFLVILPVALGLISRWSIMHWGYLVGRILYCCGLCRLDVTEEPDS